MKRIAFTFGLLCALLFPQTLISLQVTTVENVGGTWTGTKPDGSAVNCAGTATYCINETTAWAYPLGHPVQVLGLGKATPFTITGATLAIPNQTHIPFKCFNCHFVFNNTTQDGIVFDTQSKSSWNNEEGAIRYCGTGMGIRFKPQTAQFYGGTASSVPWSTDQVFRLGHVESMTPVDGCDHAPYTLIAMDPTAVCGSDAYGSSAFVDNKVFANSVFGLGYPNTLVRHITPNCLDANGVSMQLSAENVFDLGLIQGADQVEIVEGTSNGTADEGIGTNTYYGAIAHVHGSGTYAVISNGILGRFYLRAMHVDGATTPPAHLVYWGPRAYGNRVNTPQAYGWAAANAIDTQPVGPPSGQIANVVCGYAAATAC